MHVSRPPSDFDRAEQLLREHLLPEGDEPISRLNVLNAVGGLGHAAQATRRQYAIAWQLLARAGFVCPEPENPKNGDWWFVTPAGRHAATHDFEGSLRLALGSAF